MHIMMLERCHLIVFGVFWNFFFWKLCHFLFLRLLCFALFFVCVCVLFDFVVFCFYIFFAFYFAFFGVVLLPTRVRCQLDS